MFNFRVLPDHKSTKLHECAWIIGFSGIDFSTLQAHLPPKMAPVRHSWVFGQSERTPLHSNEAAHAFSHQNKRSESIHLPLKDTTGSLSPVMYSSLHSPQSPTQGPLTILTSQHAHFIIFTFKANSRCFYSQLPPKAGISFT